MNYDNSKPIYLQIVDLFYENILSKKWCEEERIPSVREVAMMVEVNPNTAIRAFTYLQEQNVIHNIRGIGYFVSKNGYQSVLNIKKSEFMKQTLPDVFKKMGLLHVQMEEVTETYNQYLKTKEHEKK